ncbi:DsbA family oxidoreductase [Micromonospora humidisoli]|uniref:DsbA family oxidoreductase n=1 Tax=Micromonospora humidisoli TaxID=2807622 RepID=A0ABS2J6F5_9ACTN|nr:DsbA family oxidoreductase [Micromonospora humidisoli]MBM7081364.1 DsbA family oxidoreductase [Micromonospora humidisoli]
MRVDSYLDVSCPWCYVTKRHLDAAVREFDGPEVRIVRHPYQIDGEHPATPMPMLTWLAGKYGEEKAARMSAEVTRYGLGMGIAFANEAGYAVNTLAAHRLLWSAGREYGEEVQGRLEELLFAGYFVDAVDVSDPEVLVDRATRAGMAPGRAAHLLATDAGTDEVRELVRRARRETAVVPLVVVDGRRRLDGPQESDRLLAALRQTAEGR